VKKRSFILFFVLFCHSASFSQIANVEVLDSLVLAPQLDSLKAKFSFGKDVPDRYALAFYTALSHCPELDSSEITFKDARIKTTLNARPTVGSLLFRKRENRKYVIRVNSSAQDSLILLSDVPFNAQIGLFGHELTHFTDYRGKGFGGVFRRMLSYSNKNGKARFEKEIDSLTVTIGLGWQLYAWSYYVLHESNGSEKYKDYKKAVYMRPEDILKQIEVIEKTAE